MSHLPHRLFSFLAMLPLLAAGCRSLPPGKAVSQLNGQETAGHAAFIANCAKCHNAYTTQALHGPSLYGIFRKPYLPSGAPARQDRVLAVILHGRNMMPAVGDDLDQQQLQDLLAYLHTL